MVDYDINYNKLDALYINDRFRRFIENMNNGTTKLDVFDNFGKGDTLETISAYSSIKYVKYKIFSGPTYSFFLAEEGRVMFVETFE